MKGVIALTVPQWSGPPKAMHVIASRLVGVFEHGETSIGVATDVYVDGIKAPFGVAETPAQVLALWAEATS